MEITISKLLEGKCTVIKENEYFSSKDYVNPFIELMKKFTNDFSVQVQLPSQLTITDSTRFEYKQSCHKNVISVVMLKLII